MTTTNDNDPLANDGGNLLDKGSRLTYRSLVRLIKESKVEFVDLKFTDLPGLIQHFSIPIKEFNQDLFVHGLGFDGSLCANIVETPA